MARLDNNIKSEFETAYIESYSYWSEYLDQASKDYDMYVGEQWDSNMKSWLLKQHRKAYVYNYIQRMVHLFEGLERKSRKALACSPVENADELTAEQFTALLMYIMNKCNGYNVFSDAFVKGPIITGGNLLEIVLDYSEDLVNGDIKIRRTPYNRFLLAPGFSERDLSDCEYILKRNYITKDEAMILLPDKANIIKGMTPKGADSKYTYFVNQKDVRGEYLMKWDEMYLRTSVPIKSLLHKPDGKIIKDIDKHIDANPELQVFIDTHPEEFEIIKGYKPSIELRILLDGEPMYVGPDRLEIDDFPFVSMLGFWDPEYKQAKHKLRSPVRALRSPQKEVNNRISKLVDMIDSVITTGWLFEKGALDDPDSVNRAGQGKNIVVNDGKMGAIQKIQPPQIPQELFAAKELFSGAIMEIAGATKDLFGLSETHDTVALAIKLRQAAAMTVSQGLYDNKEQSLQQLGSKIIKTIQVNWGPEKVQRILNQEPSEEFYTKDFSKYDCVITNALMTDTQRELFFAQLVELKQQGLDIPWELILDASPLQNKKELEEALAKQEQARAESQKSQLETEELTREMLASQVEQNRASVKRQETQAAENSASKILDLTKALKEIDKLDTQNLKEKLLLLKDIEGNQPNSITRR